jgi:hypothetical protein
MHHKPNNQIDPLLVCSWLYLWLPVLLFLTTWFRPELGVPAALLSVGAVGWLCLNTDSASDNQAGVARLGLVILSLGWTWLSGIGGFVGQHSDYDKHNLIFQDLITHDWPVQYQNPIRQNPFLCYYVAYYLPVAALVKALGLTGGWIDGLSFGWGWLGIWLVLAWVARLSGRRGLWVAGLLLLLSGLEVPLRLGWAWLAEFDGDWAGFWTAWRAKTLFRYSAYAAPRFFFSDTAWAHSLDSTPVMTQLIATPQHTLGGWLATVLWLHGRRVGWGVSQWAIILVPTLLWSPFVTVGLAACITVDALLKPGSLPGLLRQLNRTDGWLVGAMALPMGLLVGYLAAHEPVAQVGFQPTHWQQLSDAVLFVVYVSLQYGLPLWLLTAVARGCPALDYWQRLARQSMWVLLAQTLVHLGQLNDFQVRATIPAQFVLMLAVANGLILTGPDVLRDRPLRRSQWVQVVFLVWGILAMLAPLRLAGYTLWAWHLNPRRTHIADSRTDISRLDYDDHDGLPPVDYAAQYLGRLDSWYWTWGSPRTLQRNGEKSVGVR